MIDILIQIREQPADEGQVSGRVEARVYSKNPSPEEISVAARIMDNVRDIANEISQKKGAKVGMWERKKADVRHKQSDGDPGTQPDQGSGPGGNPPSGGSGPSSSTKE